MILGRSNLFILEIPLSKLLSLGRVHEPAREWPSKMTNEMHSKPGVGGGVLYPCLGIWVPLRV